MSEFTQSDQALRQMRRWRDDYRNSLAPSPLEDISQLSAQLDLTHAHPSGIAQLFASGKAPLDSLFRDTGMLRAAGRRLERVYEDQTAKSRISGVAELSMVVGVATWSGKSVPVLLYPVPEHIGLKPVQLLPWLHKYEPFRAEVAKECCICLQIEEGLALEPAVYEAG